MNPAMRIASARRQSGVSLIELMISLVLGLLVVAGAIGIFMSNRRAYAGTETLGRLQENARVAFELMSRDVREAGGNPCGKNIPIVNVLNGSATRWWTDFRTGIRGYDSGGLAGSSPGTDALEVLSGTTDDLQVISLNVASAEINVNKAGGLTTGDLVMICDYTQGAIFQLTQVQPSAGKIQHNPGNTQTPGNCTKAFDFPLKCGPPNPKSKAFGQGAEVARFSATRWYVGDTPNGRALFRTTVRSSGGGAAPATEEIAEGVQDMQLTYLESGRTAYVDSASVADWRKVTAVRLTLTFEARSGTERGQYLQGTDGKALLRTVSHVVTLRNRMS